MPMMAPRIGPHMRSQPIGGPACRMWRAARPFGASPAGITSTRTGLPASNSRSASALALSILCTRAARLSAAELRQEIGEPRVAAGGRRPLHVLHSRALRREVLGEALEPDIDDAR